MTTKELENKLKISEKTWIHCPTLELAEQVLNIFHQLGLKWCDGTHYTLKHNWDDSKENTIYCPFNGRLSSLEFAQLVGLEIINAEEFITSHTEGEELINSHTKRKEFDLESYEPRGDLQGFPKEIITRMLDYQEEQGNPRDVSVFERGIRAGQCVGGFKWNETKEGWDFWYDVIKNKDFNLFFEKYPKQNSQELKNNKNKQENNKKEEGSQNFRINDKVYDILRKEVGVVQDIDYSPNIPYGLSVKFKSGLKSYTINGCYIPEYKNPHLLHYRDDYNYDVIDFNNLPKRQEVKRWKAKVREKYYSFTSNFKVEEYIEDNDYYYDNIDYNSGNYFKTKEEAQEVADKLNRCFQELINPNS